MTVENLIEALMKQPLTALVFVVGEETLYGIDSVDYDHGMVSIGIDDSQRSDDEVPKERR